jgi:dimethylhistidine N-methyltransferase
MDCGAPAYSFHDLHPAAGSFLQDALDGLSRPQKSLPPKYFYDRDGSALFEAICRLPEYYPTRAEMAIMERHACDMARSLAGCNTLIEYGSGSGRKTRVLLEALRPAVYVPIDISAEQLARSACETAQTYPALRVMAVCADYTYALDLAAGGVTLSGSRVIYFSGSSIGNFTEAEAHAFLVRAGELAGAGGSMLIGVDLKKDPAILHAAYNDSQGVTAAFNLNLLRRMNRELGADFEVTAFAHDAFYNERRGRIEMHLVSRREQEVTFAGRRFTFRAGETIHTENSYKYSVAEFRALARGAGFQPGECWLDPLGRFSVHHLIARA